MKARVYVYYKESVFDPQGNTVCHTLQRVGFNSVKDVRVGKVMDVVLTSSTKDEARREIQKMCDKILVNPVIESYSVDIYE